MTRARESEVAGPRESLAATWARRAITLPLLLLLAALGLGGLPLWLLLSLLLDLAAGQWSKRPRSRAVLFFALYLACELWGVLAALLLWLFTLGGLSGGRARSRALHAALQRSWTQALFSGAVRIFSLRLVTEGLDLVARGPLVLLLRHCSTADTVLAAALFANPRRLLLRYVLKRELLWDPCIDVVGRRLPNAFVARGARGSQGDLAAVAQLAHGLGEGEAVLIYPEGTRFSPEKQRQALERLRARGDGRLLLLAGPMRHLLPPRPGGTLALLDAAPGADVLLLAHRGFEGAASFGRFFAGGLVGATLRVRLTRIAAHDVPRVERELWLYQQWAEMDRWLSQFDETERAQ